MQVVYCKIIKASNFQKRAIASRQCTFHSFSDNVRLIQGEAHALRTNTNQNVKRTLEYMWNFWEEEVGLENGDIHFPFISWNELESQISFTGILLPNTSFHDLSTYQVDSKQNTLMHVTGCVCVCMRANVCTHTYTSSWESAHTGHMCLKTYPVQSTDWWKASDRGTQQGR